MATISGTYRKVLAGAAAAGAAMLMAGGLLPFNVSQARADTVSDEARYVELINQSRVAEGLKPLTVHPALVDAARNWATQMQAAWDPAVNDRCEISHNPNLRTAVNANWQKLGENVGCGDVNVDELEQKFMESPKHRANIMDPTFDTIGIGIVMKGDVMFVTQQFMQLRPTLAPVATNVPQALALAAPTTSPKRGVPTTTPAKKPATTTKRRVAKK
jgi:uncharacterized protein YkwD